jgi:hypothetical protein
MEVKIKLLEFGNNSTKIEDLNENILVNINTIGEGCVWVAQVNGHDFRFKVKGVKHSVSKIKTLAKVDTEKVNSIHEFVDYAVTENRFKQGIGIIFPDGDIDIKKTLKMKSLMF